jgi:hypothetical protein
MSFAFDPDEMLLYDTNPKIDAVSLELLLDQQFKGAALTAGCTVARVSPYSDEQLHAAWRLQKRGMFFVSCEGSALVLTLRAYGTLTIAALRASMDRAAADAIWNALRSGQAPDGSAPAVRVYFGARGGGKAKRPLPYRVAARLGLLKNEPIEPAELLRRLDAAGLLRDPDTLVDDERN